MIKDLLKELGIEESAIEKVEKGEADVKTVASEFLNKRKELMLNDSTLIGDLKKRFNDEQFPAIVNPFINALKNKAGLTKEEIEALKEEGENFPSWKKVVEKAFEKTKQAGSGDIDELKKRLFDVQNEYESHKQKYQSDIESLKKSYEAEKMAEKSNAKLIEIIEKSEYIIPATTAAKLIRSELAGFSMQVDDKGKLQILNADGTRVANDKHFLTPEQLIEQIGESLNILKKSNGAAPNGKHVQGQQGKQAVTPLANSMQERINKARGL